jgi:hypothetical protein
VPGTLLGLQDMLPDCMCGCQASPYNQALLNHMISIVFLPNSQEVNCWVVSEITGRAGRVPQSLSSPLASAELGVLFVHLFYILFSSTPIFLYWLIELLSFWAWTDLSCYWNTYLSVYIINVTGTLKGWSIKSHSDHKGNNCCVYFLVNSRICIRVSSDL